MMKSYECLCGNVSLIIKGFKDTVEFPIPKEWNEPILGRDCSVEMKYFQLVSIRQTPQFLIYKCLNCGDDVCCIKGKEGIINKELQSNEERRKDMSYSDTFGVYIRTIEKPKEIIEKKGNNKMKEFDEQLDKQLLSKKQKKVDELFRIKEQKIREFVMQQEDLFDTQRQIIQDEYERIVNDFIEIHSTPNAHSCDKIKRFHTWGSSKPLKIDGENEVFELDEEQNEEITGNVVLKKEQSPLPLGENGEDGIINEDLEMAPCCSVPVRLPSCGFDQLEVKGNTFEEYASTVKEEVPISSFKQNNYDCD